MKVSNLDTPVKQGDNQCFRVQFKRILVCGKSAWQKLLWPAIVCLWGQINLCFDSHLFFVCMKIRISDLFSGASSSEKRFAIYMKGFICVLNSMGRFGYIKLSLNISSNELQPTCLVTNGAGRPAWRPHLEQICVWQTFGLLTTQRQGPSCSTGVCQLSTQMGLWESLAWCLPKSWCNASVLVIDASTVTEAIFTEMEYLRRGPSQQHDWTVTNAE